MTRDEIVDFIEMLLPFETGGVLLADGYEDAFIGLSEKTLGGGEIAHCAAYDYEKCIRILIDGGMEIDEAYEYFEFNVIGSASSSRSPSFVRVMQQEGSKNE
jgi:hypothetical protein